MKPRIGMISSRALPSLALAAALILASFFLPWWAFFVAVPLLFLAGYRATAAACALVLDIWWAAPSPFLPHLAVTLFPLTTTVVLLAALRHVLRRRVLFGQP